MTGSAEECADREAFVRVTAGRFGYDPFDVVGETAFDVRIERGDRQFVGSVVTTGVRGGEDTHEIYTADRCMALWDRIAQHVQYVWEMARDTPPPQARLPRAASVAEEPAAWLLGGSISAELYGYSPVLAPGVRVHVGRRWGDFSVRGELRAQWPRSLGADAEDVKIALMGGGLSGCWQWRRLGVCGVVLGLSLWHPPDGAVPSGVFLGSRVAIDVVRAESLRMGLDVEALVLAGEGRVLVEDVPRWELLGVVSAAVRIEWGIR